MKVLVFYLVDFGFAAHDVFKKLRLLESTKEWYFKRNAKTFQTYVTIHRKITNQVCVNTAPIKLLTFTNN